MADAATNDAPTKPAGSSYLFNADAQAVLEVAPNLDAGLELLSQAHDSRAWDKPEEAANTMASYAQQLRYRFKDDATYSEDDTIHHAPIDIGHFTGKGQTAQDKIVDRISQWEAANKAFLAKTDSSLYLTDREKLTRSVDETASNLRRQTEGANENWFQDKMYRAGLGASEGILKAVGAKDTLKYLQEHTDPAADKTIFGALASGVGFVSGYAATSAVPVVGKIAGTGYLLGTGYGETKDAYNTAMANTGDRSMARKAAIIEGGAQALQVVIGPQVVNGAMSRIGAKVFGTEVGVGLKQAAKTIGVAGAEAGVIGAGGAALSSEAQQFESYRPPTTAWEDLGKVALVNAVLGAGGHAVREAGGALAGTPDVHRGDPQFPETMSQAAPGVEGEIPPFHASSAPVDIKATQLEDIPAPDEPAPVVPQHDFQTSDGSKYTLTDDSQSASRTSSAGVAGHPMDRTFYVKPEEAAKLSALKNTPNSDGTLPQVTTAGGELYVKNIKNHPLVEDGTIKPAGRRQDAWKPEQETAPAVGLHPVEVNGARTANGVAPEYRAHIGNDITEMNVPVEGAPEAPKPLATQTQEAVQETGAAAPRPVAPFANEGKSAGAKAVEPGTFDPKLTETRRRVLDNPKLSDETKQAVLDNSGQYYVMHHAEYNSAADDYINHYGIEGARESVLKDTHFTPETDAIAIRVAEHDNAAVDRALAAGDTESAAKIAGRASQMLGYLEASANLYGTGNRYRQEILKRPSMYLMGVRENARKRATAEVAQAQGRSPEEVTGLQKELQDASEKIAVLETKGKELQGPPKPKAPGEKPAPEKPPQDSLTGEDRVQYDTLTERVKDIKKVTDKVDEKVAKTLEANKETMTKMGKLVDALKFAHSQSAKEKIAKEVFKLEGNVLKEARAPSNQGFWGQFWSANVLSGLGTIAKKTHFELMTSLLTVPASLSLAARDPRVGSEFIKSFVRAAGTVGKDTAVETFLKGESPQAKLDPSKEININSASTAKRLFPGRDLVSNPPDWSKASLANALPAFEGMAKYFDNLKSGKIVGEQTAKGIRASANLQPIAKALSQVGWTFRALSAPFAGYERSLQEGTAAAKAYLDIRKESPELKGKALKDALGEKLFNSASHWDSALTRAKEDAARLEDLGVKVSERETRLRASEIVMASRDTAFNADVNKFVDSLSLLRPVPGMIGKVIEGLVQMRSAKANVFGKEIQPLFFIAPFLRVMGNMIHLGGDYTPGLRVVDQSIFNESLGDIERTGLIGRQLIGTVLTAAVAGTIYAFKDDKNPPIAIHGAGPTDPAQKEAFYGAGKLPYSVEVNGHSFSYLHTPFLFLLGAMGHLSDEMRYNKKFTGDFGSGAVAIIAGTADAFVHQSFLGSLGKLYEAIHEENLAKAEDVLYASGINTAKGFIPMAGMLGSITRITEDPVSTFHDLKAKMLENIPLAQEAANKWLNVFGKPINSPFYKAIGNFYSDRTTDVNFNWMADNGYGVTIPLSIKLPPSMDGSPLEKQRGTNLGAEFSGLLSPDERTKLVLKAGPQIEQMVNHYRQQYGNSKFNPAVQKTMTEETNSIVKSTMQELFIH